jgi:hypothetical protein
MFDVERNSYVYVCFLLQEHSDAVAAAAVGGRGAYLTYAGEGHSIRKESNVLHMWNTVERFLTRSDMCQDCLSLLCEASLSDAHRVCRSVGLEEPPDVPSRLIEGHTCKVHWDSCGFVAG